jgi:hypothetical protein
MSFGTSVLGNRSTRMNTRYDDHGYVTLFPICGKVEGGLICDILCDVFNRIRFV